MFEQSADKLVASGSLAELPAQELPELCKNRIDGPQLFTVLADDRLSVQSPLMLGILRV